MDVAKQKYEIKSIMTETIGLLQE